MLLPGALLFCCYNALEDIVNGTTFNGVHVELSPKDKSAVILGRHRLTQRALNRAYRPFLGPDKMHSHCIFPDVCSSAREKAYRQTVKDGWLNPFEDPDDVVFAETCNPCMNQLTVHRDARLESMWETLPSAFDLPDWATLRRLSAHEYYDED